MPKESYMPSLPNKNGRKTKGLDMPAIPKLVTLPGKEGKTKRRTSSGTSSQKGKGRISQPRRVRPRLGNKPAKVSENDSDGSSSEKAEDNNESCNEMSRPSPGMQKSKEVENSELSQHEKNLLGQGAAGEDSDHGGRLVARGNGNAAGKNEKLENIIDPVQAMLRDMIPFLGNNKAESTDRLVDETTIAAPATEGEISTVEPCPAPRTRKKVSYKDLAEELLKDL